MARSRFLLSALLLVSFFAAAAPLTRAADLPSAEGDAAAGNAASPAAAVAAPGAKEGTPAPGAPVAAAPVAIAPPALTAAAILGCEDSRGWETAPSSLLQVMPEEQFWSARPRIMGTTRVEAVSFRALASGAVLTTSAVTRGKAAILWTNHPRFPTLHSLPLNANWEKNGLLTFDLYSGVNTGEVVVVAVESDSAATPYKDYFYLPLCINWQGAKSLALPFAAFRTLGQPAGWGKIDSLFFFTKAFGCQPHPYTELVLDNIAARPAPAQEPQAWKEQFAPLPEDAEKNGLPVRVESPGWQMAQRNHTFPETANDRPVYAPLVYQHYFAAERAQFAYYPRFAPGYVSFDPQGKAVINNGYGLQWKDAEGKWALAEFRPVLQQWAKEQGWPGIRVMWNLYASEKAVRFDKSGDAYVCFHVAPLDLAAAKDPFPWQKRTCLLLHSRDRFQTWTVYVLPGRTAEFEKIDGHNAECLDNPPLLLLGDYKHFKESDQGGYLLVPQKNPDGTLRLPAPVKFSASCIGAAQHSGGGNQVITKNGKAYVIFSYCADPEQIKAGKAPACPPIPAGHPGQQQTYLHTVRGEKVTEYAKNGVPAFIVEYDLKSGAMSAPVYLGSGGGTMDGHNWAAITVDGEGYFHVLINGHHNPANYTRSRKPLDITAWTAPEYVLANTQEPNVTYGSINCDKAGNLYTFHRSTKDVYNNHLALYVKPKGQPWREEQTLVTPFRIMYGVWGHKIMYNPVTDQMTLNFFSQSAMRQITRDQYEFDLFYWPDHEIDFYRSQPPHVGKPSIPPEANGKFATSMVVSQGSELTTLISQPGGKWKLAVSEDLP